ncbi:MAG: helix-turn-helix transcriptional regulator, partial [Ktedonobacteraceae bacterium]|nr:helix-turn-helix transcriptional regulator [Ktedonobacteraceae bacterium]
PNCGSREVLDVLADKWTMITMYTLAQGTRRFGELQRDVGGISQKMLTQTLRKLESNGLVERTVYPVIPPRVEYNLTALGETFIEALSSVCRWAEDHRDDIEAARAG